jgi:hypothetical protein
MLSLREVKEKIKERVGGSGEHQSIKIARQAVRSQKAVDHLSLATALDDIVTNKRWQEARSSTGSPFDTFTSFLLDEAPYGLGISDQSVARMVRQALLDHKHFREWTATMKVAARRPGNPGNDVNHESSGFYTVDRGSTSRDRLLLLLESQSPLYFERVCNGEFSPHRAAIDAGLIAPRPKMHTSLESIFRTAHGMKIKAQSKLLKRLFKELPLESQCTLIADCIEPKLAVAGLATKWREARES